MVVHAHAADAGRAPRVAPLRAGSSVEVWTDEPVISDVPVPSAPVDRMRAIAKGTRTGDAREGGPPGGALDGAVVSG